MAASERVIDPTRQGIGVGDAEGTMLRQAAPVSLEDACAIVDGWADGYAPFRLYQVSRTLREAYRDLGEAYAIVQEHRDNLQADSTPSSTTRPA